MAEAGNSGINFMAMLNPQFAAQQQKFALQQQMAQQMMQQGAEQPPTAQLANPGGMVIKNSPTAALARALQEGLGAYSANKNIDNQIQAYKDMGAQNSAPQDPNSMNNIELMHDMMARGSGTAEYQNRMAANRARDEAFAKAGASTTTLADGTVVPTSNIVGSGTQPQQPPTIAQGNLPAPVPQDQMPPAPQMVNGKPQAPANMDELLNQQSENPTNVMPNVIPGTTPGVPAVNSNSPEGAAHAAGLKADATKTGENAADVGKTLTVMSSNLPMVLQRLDKMRGAAKDASYGAGTTAGEDGSPPPMVTLHDALKDKTAIANGIIQQTSAQGVLPELGPTLAQAGIKGNKFLETLSSNASAIPLHQAPEVKLNTINGLESQYINNLKSTAAQARAYGQVAPTDAQIDAQVAKIKGASVAPVSAGVTHIYQPGKGIVSVAQ